MHTFLWLYQLITVHLLFQFQKTKIISIVTVSENSTVLCFQTKFVLEKQNLLKHFTVIIISVQKPN